MLRNALALILALCWLAEAPPARAEDDGVAWTSRYGALRVDTRPGEESPDIHGGELSLDGRVFHPRVQGNDFLLIERTWQSGALDFVLLQNVGGTACPAVFSIVILGPGIRSATPFFGTCSDIVINATQYGDSVTAVVIHDYLDDGVTTYILHQGRVTENGVPLVMRCLGEAGACEDVGILETAAPGD